MKRIQSQPASLLIVPEHPAVSQAEFTPELKGCPKQERRAGRHPHSHVSGSPAALFELAYGGGRERGEVREDGLPHSSSLLPVFTQLKAHKYKTRRVAARNGFEPYE